MQSLVCQQTQLELDALWDGKPMKAVPHHVLDMNNIVLSELLTNRTVYNCKESLHKSNIAVIRIGSPVEFFVEVAMSLTLSN